MIQTYNWNIAVLYKFLFQMQYSYTDLGSLEAGKKYNVYGVVKFVKQPYKTKGTGMLSYFISLFSVLLFPPLILIFNSAFLTVIYAAFTSIMCPRAYVYVLLLCLWFVLTDYCSMISIIDKSSQPDEKLKCLLFERAVANLPDPNIGDIIRFHRLSVSVVYFPPVAVCCHVHAI